MLLIAVVLTLDFSAQGILTHSPKNYFGDTHSLAGGLGATVSIDSKMFWYARVELPSSAEEKELCNLSVLEEGGSLTRNPNSTFQKYSLLHVRLTRRRIGHCLLKPVLADELDS